MTHTKLSHDPNKRVLTIIVVIPDVLGKLQVLLDTKNDTFNMLRSRHKGLKTYKS